MIIACGACGSPRSAPQEAPRPASCPATYAEVAINSACEDESATCSYAEGRCWCGPRSYCGGIEPPPELLEELRRPAWQCEPVRTDGCPEAPPSGSCSEEGKACAYGDCCVQAIVCTSGNWVPGPPSCPP